MYHLTPENIKFIIYPLDGILKIINDSSSNNDDNSDLGDKSDKKIIYGKFYKDNEITEMSRIADIIDSTEL